MRSRGSSVSSASSSTSSTSSPGSSAGLSSKPSASHEITGKRKRAVEDEDDSDNSDASDSDSEAEVSALSHAAKRKQKKLLKRQADSTESKKSTNGGKSTAAEPSKRQNSVWVGNLAFKTTPDALRQFFDGVGEITRVHLPTKAAPPKGSGGPPRKENRGFAYVDFATPKAKAAAIALSEKNLDGRRLLIKDGDDFTGRPEAPKTSPEDAEGATTAPKTPGLSKSAQRILATQKLPPAPTLFLGNLGFETTEDSIRQLFEVHRKPAPKKEGEDGEKDVWLRKVRMGTFEDTGHCKGFAFLDFTKLEHATAALVNPKNHQLNGRKLVVEYASADAVRRGGGAPRPLRSNERPDKRVGPRQMRKKPQVEKAALIAQEEAATAPEKPAGAVKFPPEKGAEKYKSGPGGDRKERGNKRRAAPGAALAMAKREQVSIVPSSGKRIVFDD
ncbi:hypothetical protein FA95DRAFT_1552104 [Auriscalpium vulgare]|uniref:Uncharacterized protein n=1 Tax=Auriscalpium vulgare TaxID=40419 RepID=A0ACB8SAT7_9AGAM|nr:hypothetical protein FA95DRAFT_1552104 [Auriscalpium vulgare]